VTKKIEADRWQRKIMQLVFYQFVLTLGLGAVGALFVSAMVGKSALVGGVIAVLPSYYLAKRMLSRRKELSAADSLHNNYVGSVIKIVYTVALFLLVIISLEVNFLILISAYFVVVLTNWFGLVFMDFSESAK
jgi:ATP synthase protein I